MQRWKWLRRYLSRLLILVLLCSAYSAGALDYSPIPGAEVSINTITMHPAGNGIGQVKGTGVAGQVAYFLSDDTVSSSAGITLDAASILTMIIKNAATPSSPAAGFLALYSDSTQKILYSKNDAGALRHVVETKDCVATSQVVTKINDDGTVTCGGSSAGDVPSTRTLTMTGTANQIIITGGTQDLSANRTWTFATPQDIATSSSPQFSALSLGGVVGASNTLKMYGTISGNIIIKPPTTPISWTWTLPTAVNSIGYVLMDTTGTGITEWQPVATSVTNSDGSLTISPTQGNVVASLNTAHANTWTATQSFRDTSAAFDVSLIFTSNTPILSANHSLTLNMQDVNHTIHLGTGGGITFPQTASDVVAMYNVANIFTQLQSITLTGVGPAGVFTVVDAGTAIGNGGAFTVVNTNTTVNNQVLVTMSEASTSGARFAAQFTSHTVGSVSADFYIQTRNAGTMAERLRIASAGAVTVQDLKTTGAAGGKKVVCVDTTTGQLYASSTGVDCSN
jgi:hypothetical protein